MNLESLQSFCLNLPAATEDIKWGHDLCFSVGGKMFCVTSLEPPMSVSFKVTDDEFGELSAREGFMPAPYMARAKWVLVTDMSVLKTKEWQSLVKQSYELIKAKLTKKLRSELDITD
jgi:predicted DNA-binding protein (MmcQ/YjbR family)